LLKKPCRFSDFLYQKLRKSSVFLIFFLQSWIVVLQTCIGSKTDYETKIGSSCNFLGTGTSFFIITSLETFLKTFSANIIFGRTKSSSFGRNSLLFSRTAVQKKLEILRFTANFCKLVIKKKD
jgi:hypothetical protein